MTGEPRIEEFFLGELDLEAYYTEFPLSAMAIQPQLPDATKRARELEAHGYHRKPPRNGRRYCWALESMDRLDEVSIRAIRRVIETQVSAGEIQQVKEAYRASTLGDAFWIAFDTHMHPYTVIAVLRHLEERGEIGYSD